MKNESYFPQWSQTIDRNGIHVAQDVRGFVVTGEDFVYPYLILILCTRGSARAAYDMQEFTFSPNTFGVFMPGHILRPIDWTPDFTYVAVAVSVDMKEDLKMQIFNHDYRKFHAAPTCLLNDTQVRRLLGSQS